MISGTLMANNLLSHCFLCKILTKINIEVCSIAYLTSEKMLYADVRCCLSNQYLRRSLTTPRKIICRLSMPTPFTTLNGLCKNRIDAPLIPLT